MAYPHDSNPTENLFDALFTQRAIRRFRDDDVPDELIWKVVDAAIRAPSGSNRQPWGFVVVREVEERRAIATAMRAFLEANAEVRTYFEAGSASEDRSARLMFSGALELAGAFDRAPVLIVPCVYPAKRLNFMSGSSIFPAIQNLLLAARGLGLGTVLTTLSSGIEPTLRSVLQLPEDAHPVALIPVGFPAGRFGPNNRKPVESVLHWGTWGALRERPAGG